MDEQSEPVEVLRSLVNEVGAMVGMAEHELRAIIGNTNMACLEGRIREAKLCVIRHAAKEAGNG